MDTVKSLAPYLSALVLFGAWFALIILGQAPAQDFVTAITGAIAGLGIHGVHQAKDKANATK